jgi:hypothetical protein
MDLSILGQALGIKIVDKKDSHSDNVKKLTFDLYSKLSLGTAEIKEKPIKNIPHNPHSLGNLGNPICIKVKNDYQDNDKFYNCSSSDKVEWLRENICKDFDIGMDECQLMSGCKILQDGKTLSNYKLRNNSKITCIDIGGIIGGGIEEFDLDDNLLDPGYDYDFTNIKDNIKYYRGGLEYKRPCGWNRYALKVYGKFDNNLWLGDTGKSNNDSEWAVAYHGTKQEFAESICKTGLRPGHVNAYGVGVYCTPNIKTAEGYASSFKGKDGNKYKLVFQVRVKPSAIVKCTDVDSSAPSDYWYIKDKKDIRCYSICVKKDN